MADLEVSHPPGDILSQLDDDVFRASTPVAAGDFLHFLLIPVHELFSPFHLAAGAELEPEELALGERRTLALGEALAATGRGRRCLSSAVSLPFPRGISGCGLSIQPV